MINQPLLNEVIAKMEASQGLIEQPYKDFALSVLRSYSDEFAKACRTTPLLEQINWSYSGLVDVIDGDKELAKHFIWQAVADLQRVDKLDGLMLDYHADIEAVRRGTQSMMVNLSKIFKLPIPFRLQRENGSFIIIDIVESNVIVTEDNLGNLFV